MLDEVDYIQENARKVKRNGIPINIPMYFFIAEDSSVDIIPNWEKELSEYAFEIKYGKLKLLDCGHYVHHEKSDVIAYEAKKFIEEIYSN